ncbi:MAG TPA: efflux RND transporter periplasmic adaptor subunit [Anaerolineales bacterium]|nr:efflux RND transporter periplasmic adaptor subunit [Anaerolineales bacterium]HMX74074.1 efflux RND transporter periplasmic adaptor subunit [Anaerolineales bacterium]HMZ43044.1 efflux RND transporter periplasmic adaptor subunit [Anaerolineales bacterium]HNA54520.1 efflux RND transporter periplasmic adaptor subunit [Anaerolineales bacterium]HNB85378.1 efflux RND transporter periplasmic adaptor subunit [Anaerolineales bacterium]
MNHKSIPVPVRIVLALVVLGAIGYLAFLTLNTNGNGELTASGSIEAVIVNVSPELAGKVTGVDVAEGALVNANDPLLHLDPSLLTAQRAVAASALDSAKAALTTAQTKFDQTLQAALSAQDAQRAKDLRVSAPDEFNQPLWFIDQTDQLAAAQTEVDAAKIALDEANANLEKVISDLGNAQYLDAEKKLSEARAAFLIADKVKVQAENAVEAGAVQDAAYDYYNDVLDELQRAQDDFNALTNTEAEDDIKYARGQVVIAQQRYDAAYTRLLSLQTGTESPAVISAKNTLDQAQTAVDQAQANLDLLDAQIAKLDVYAVMSGVILSRNVEPGEFVQPGAVALTMADLTNLTITVYVPEDRYGQVSLGQTAEVSVDSFPGLTFTATVVHIADQAEFTPRNVQTVEGRSSTFYAIKLQVSDPDGKLKIGMPADVVFK